MTTAELLFPQPVGHPHMAWDTGDQGSADSPFARLTSPVPSYQTASPIIGVKEYRRLGRPKYAHFSYFIILIYFVFVDISTAAHIE